MWKQIILLPLFVSFGLCIVVTNLKTNATFTLTSPYYRYGVQPLNNTFNLTGVIIPIGANASALQTCAEITPPFNSLVKGKIAMLVFLGGCSTERHIQIAQDAGAKGVIVITALSWFFCRVRSPDADNYNISIPAVCMESSDTTAYFNATSLTQGLLADFSEVDNPWDEVNKGAMIFLQIFFIGFLLLGTTLDTIQIVRFVYRRQVKLLAPYIYLFHAIANVFQAANWIDYNNYWGVFYIYPNGLYLGYIANMFNTISFALVHLAIVRIILKLETKMKYVIFSVILTISIILLSIISTSIFMAFTAQWNQANFNFNVVNAVIIIILDFSYFVSAIYLFKKFCSFATLKSANRSEMNRQYTIMAICLVTLGFAATLRAINWIFLANVHSYPAPTAFFPLVLGSISQIAGSIAVFFMFKPKMTEKQLSNKSFEKNSKQLHEQGENTNNNNNKTNDTNNN